MSVLIKGMEMPNNCGECQFCHTEFFTEWCCPTGREDVSYDSVPQWCPLDDPVKHGRWIEGKTIYFCGEHQLPMTCSVCGRTALNEPWHYCPNCGARMRGEEDEVDSRSREH